MRSRRSCLAVPARPARKLEKAALLSADEIVIDLEDSVPTGLKVEARSAVVDALAGSDWAAATVSVRINAIHTPWFEDDLRAIATASRLDSIVIPKVERPADLTICAELLDSAEGDSERVGPTGLQALIETAAGLQAVDEISRATARLETLILGPADMSVSLGFPSPAEGPQWDYPRGAVVVAARAAGLQAIDGPFLQISDPEGLADSAARARDFGFDGKWALHPAQIEPLNETFAPSPEQLAEAESILAALDAAGAAGAALHDGEMVDEASRKRAELILARSQRSR